MSACGSLFRLASLRVSLHGRDVGTLAETKDGLMAFEYAASWLQDGFSISPLSLPLEKGVFVAKPRPFDGAFGVFDDSLPDGWGRLLVDRLLREQGIEPASVSPLMRLSIVGASGMGALEYVPETPLVSSHSLTDFDAIARECARVLKADFSEDLDELFALGGSSGGARPKILTEIDGEDWIVKFPSSHDPADIGRQEYDLALAARACGIDMPPVRLFPSRQCAGYFGVKRFDRQGVGKGTVRKMHMASAGALLEASHRVPSLDYDLLMRLTLRVTEDFEDAERLYRLMCFNVYAGNKDDHAKNFSFLFDEDARCWRLSPAYDLTRNSGMNGEHATMVNGKGRDIETEDLMAVGVRAGLSRSRAASIAGVVREAVAGHDA